MRILRLAPLVLLALPACLGGGTPELSGEPVGQYMVQALLTSNECGAGHPAPPSLGFYVELRHLVGSASGYWKLPDGPLVDGSLVRDRDFRFASAEEVVGLPPDLDYEYPGCNLERREIVAGLFDGSEGNEGDGGVIAEEESSFSGTTTVTVSALPGGDCTPLLAVYGGAFSTLPCSIEYELEGARLAEPLF